MVTMINKNKKLSVNLIKKFSAGELQELCKATEEAIEKGIGFSWIKPPPRQNLENYWKGVLAMPQRKLFIGSFEGAVAASLQLVFPNKSNEASSFSASIDTHFVSPWARGHGLARMLLEAGEDLAYKSGFSQILLEVRKTQDRAINLYENAGYIRWGILPAYHIVNEKVVPGLFYHKRIDKNK
jgi:ribosomal protein S18 acetylase RimI-like enzyme